MQIDGINVVARKAVAGDRNFILDTWLRSAKDLSKMGKDDFFCFTRPQVTADVQRGTVLVACDEESPGTIHGWACWRDDVLRWAYTVFPLRNLGIFHFLKDSYVEQASAAEAGRAA